MNQWTEALAKSKYNEIERGKLAAYESQVSLKEPVVIKNSHHQLIILHVHHQTFRCSSI